MATSSKATFVLPTELLEELRHFVKAGLADSLSSLVRQSLEAHARSLRELELAQQFHEASQDPQFMADLEDSTADFNEVSLEGLDG